MRPRWVRAAMALAVPRSGGDCARDHGPGPTISGLVQAGAVLTATATWKGTPAPTPAWAWLSLPAPHRLVRRTIAGATSTSYRITRVRRHRGAACAPPGHERRRLRRATLESDGRGGAGAHPDPDPDPHADRIPHPPTPTPTASPTPTPTPSATATARPTGTATPTAPTPTTVVTASASPVPAVIAAPVATPARPPRLLRPFPVVRIKGVLTAGGARVTLLSVRAPRGSRVTVTCRGSDCPSRRYTSPASTGRLRPFERALSAGTRLEIRVTKAGFIGKSTVFVICRRAAPKRTDRCLPPGAKRAVRCPAR